MTPRQRLLHYSAHELTEIRDRQQEVDGPMPAGFQFKPHGLWVSVEGEDDWRSWCEGASFGLDRMEHVYAITLAENANILRIENSATMLAFDAEYRFPHPDLGRMSYIDWPRVAERFDGVIIAPYQWKHRLELMWYYGWDCASGCIWNARAVSCFEVAETVE